MSVRLISYTKPVADEFWNGDNCFSTEDLIAYIASVSNPTNQNNTKTI